MCVCRDREIRITGIERVEIAKRLIILKLEVKESRVTLAEHATL